MLKFSELLNTFVQARERILDETAWCKRHMYHRGARCLIGAVINAGSDHNVGHAISKMPVGALSLLTEVIQRQHPHYAMHGGAGVPLFFNDAQTTTHADVIAVLDECIALCE
jgi:hypothetical protein